MFTEDPGTPAKGRWEINTASYSELNNNSLIQLPLIDLNYGYQNNVQLKFETPYVLYKNEAGLINSGIGYILPGIKYRFFEDSAKDLAVSFYPQFTLALAGEFENELELPFQIEKSFRYFTLDWEAGYAIRAADHSYFINGFLIGIYPTKKTELMAEIYLRSPVRNIDQTGAILNFGTRYAIASRITVLAALGTEILRYDADDRTSFLYIGLQWSL